MNEEKAIVESFAGLMYKKIELRHNRYAPLGWRTMDKKRIIALLKGEIEEYEEQGDSDECVDIANYAMFLFELSKK